MASEHEEQELEDAEAEFLEDEPTEEEEQKLPEGIIEHIERNQEILTALGFTPHYHDKDPEGTDETNFGIRVMNMKIGVKFNDVNPAGKVWAYVLTEDNKKEFIKNGNLKQLPLVQRYLDIQAGEKQIPEAIVTGRLIERVGKGIKIEIEEDGEKKEIFFGLGAVKKHDTGQHFVPSGFSKPSKDNPDGKMDAPRDILLPELDNLAQPPAVDTKAQKPEDRDREEAEAQRITEEQGRAPAATTTPLPASATKAVKTTPATDSEKVDYFVRLIGEITEKVGAEGRILANERGYAINLVFNAITRDRRSELIAELKEGGDREEQA